MEYMVEHLRQLIRDRGYMSGMELTMAAMEYGKGIGVEIHPDEILGLVPGDGVHVVEYTNAMVEAYRVKDLYYYNPNL